MSKIFRYGFKTEAEYYSDLYRQELELEPHAPLCPRILANHLGIPVKNLSSHPGVPDDIREFWRTNDINTFSGLIISDGPYKEIVHNDYHHPRRQNSNIAHEISHIILGHSLVVPIKSNGERDYDPEIEEEAKWLGATLLIPKKSAIHIILNSIPMSVVQSQYGVSEKLFKYRVQVTDAYRAVGNIRQKYGIAASRHL